MSTGTYEYKPTELKKMINRFDRNTPHTVTVRELEGLIDTGVDINSYEGSHFNLLLIMSWKFAGTYFDYKPEHITCYEQMKLLEKLVKCALENGADPNLVDEFGEWTVLNNVLDGKHSWKMCRLLLSYGADVNAKNGYSPVEMVLTNTYSGDYTAIKESRCDGVIHMWQRMFVEAGADALAVVDPRQHPRWNSPINCHISMLNKIEECFMIDFYVEHSV